MKYSITKSPERGDQVKCAVCDHVNGGTKAINAVITRIVYYNNAVFCFEVKTEYDTIETSYEILANYGQ